MPQQDQQLLPSFLQISQEDFLRHCQINPHQKALPLPTITTKLYEGVDTTGGRAKSQTVVATTCSIQGSDEQVTIPVWTSTKVEDVQAVLATKLGVDPSQTSFVTKQGCSYRTLFAHEEVPRKVLIRGIKSFKRQYWAREHPIAIIGAGHVGLKTAMVLLDGGDQYFVIFDWNKEVGGTSWHKQANATSKLQTETGVYHLEWHARNPIPTYFSSPWPSRRELLDHFIRISAEYGITPYCRLCTNVRHMDIIKRGDTRSVPAWEHNDHYVLHIENTDGSGDNPNTDPTRDNDRELEMFKAWSIMFYPGNLTLPRKETYKGEEVFGGEIGYGMHSAFDYHATTGECVMIVGHGAFAVENVRTCCEHSCKKAYMVCRRKNLACPRVVSWMANRSLNPVSAASFLRQMDPMYKLINVDHWSYYAIHSNEKRTAVTINQKARFGIGDIYFLAIYWGKLEVVVEPKGPIKRLSHHTVHLESGRKLEVSCILKLLGFYGEPDNDRLMKIKDMVGNWANGDIRRWVWAEPISVQANNFGGTSLSPGALGSALLGVYFMHFPGDLQPLLQAGMLPKFSGEPHDFRPVYVIDARHATSSSFLIASMVPGKAEEDALEMGITKPLKQRLMHPVNRFIAEAKADWDQYCQKFKDEGIDKPWPEYPYTPSLAREMIKAHMRETNEPPLPSDWEDLELGAPPS